jgi:hypothetical protein
MDLEMPVMDGREAIRRLRAESRFTNLPIIVMTAHAQGVELQRALAQGASSYIAKPFDPDELLASIARYCHRCKPDAGAIRRGNPAEEAFLAALRAIPEVDVVALESVSTVVCAFLPRPLSHFVDDARQLPAAAQRHRCWAISIRRGAMSIPSRGWPVPSACVSCRKNCAGWKRRSFHRWSRSPELAAVERCLAAVLDGS